jgi:hypothetical protein
MVEDREKAKLRKLRYYNKNKEKQAEYYKEYYNINKDYYTERRILKRKRERKELYDKFSFFHQIE